MAKTGNLSCRVDAGVKAAAERAARDDHRSLASLVEKMLATYLAEAGYLPETKYLAATGYLHSDAGADAPRAASSVGPATPAAAAAAGPAPWRPPEPGRADVPSWPDR